jgi:hypothetical protein
MYKRILLCLFLGFALIISLDAQEKKSVFKDTLDHKMDFSNYLINMHGFVPWPVIISEPALGNFGLAMALVFMSPKKQAKPGEQFHFPDITGVAGMWTLNNSWGVGAMRQGTFPSIGLRYTVGGGYAVLNVNFYREFGELGEKEFLFTLKPILANVDASENLWRNKLFVGLNYKFTYTDVSYDISKDTIVSKIFNKTEINKYNNVGTLSLYAEWDSRNTIFTPDKGIRFKPSFGLSRAWTGSYVDFESYDVFTNIFFQPVKPWVCGFKADFKGVSDDAPFYMIPYIDMRGIAAMRYQGQQVLTLETEQRFDFGIRWSLVGFFGTGKTFSDMEFMKDETWHCSGGAGFRYLVARLFKLRMGIDIARGPDQFAYYIVFGHYWNR